MKKENNKNNNAIPKYKFKHLSFLSLLNVGHKLVKAETGSKAYTHTHTKTHMTTHIHTYIHTRATVDEYSATTESY